MSWLVAVCFPGLLMFSAVGLQRLESVLHADRPTPAELLARLEQLTRAAREAARECTGPLPLKSFSATASRPQPKHHVLVDEPGLPTRLSSHTQPNPHFQPTEYANTV